MYGRTQSSGDTVNPVEIIYFPKLCKTCKRPMKHIKKMSCQWYECEKCEEAEDKERDKKVEAFIQRLEKRNKERKP